MDDRTDTSISDERRDTKGRLIGRRSPANKNPRRNETGLCPGLSSAMTSMIEQLDNFAVGVRGMAQDGLVGSEGVVAEVERIAQLARDLRGEWVDA